MVGAVIHIQRVFRGCLLRTQHYRRIQAASKIQTWWRTGKVQRRVPYIRGAIRRIRGMFSRYHHVKKVGALKNVFHQCHSTYIVHGPLVQRNRVGEAAIAVQRMERGCNSRRSVRQRQASALILQKMARRWLAHRILAKRRKALAKMCAVVDGAYRRKQYNGKRQDIIHLQAHMKMRLAVRRLAEARNAQIHISRIHRGRMARREFARMRRAGMKAQTGVRYHVAWIRYQRQCKAVRKIQAAWFRYMVKFDDVEIANAATKIAAAWRARQQRRRHLAMKRAARTIVGAARMWQVRELHHRRIAAVTKIAATWRGYCTRANVQHMLRAAYKIKRWWLNITLYHDIRQMTILTSVTLRLMRKNHRTKHALVLQRWFRSWKREQTPICRFVRAITHLQSCFRAYRAKQEAELRALLSGVRLKRYVSKRVVLEKDKHGKLSKARELSVEEEKEPSGIPASLRSAKIVNLSALAPRQVAALEIAIRSMQGRFRWFHYLNAMLTIQRIRRGTRCRRFLRRRSACALMIQCCWRRYRATKDVAFRRQLAMESRAKPDDTPNLDAEEQQKQTEGDTEDYETLASAPDELPL